MVDLLARHLYSGPRVFIRELLQNAADAVVARQQIDPSAPATVRLHAHTLEGVATLDVTDTGIGLTAEQAQELLATIGRSSKRDADLGLGRGEYIGQFGIGLLASFMVSEEVEVVSRSIAPGAAGMLWRGRDDGTFEVSELKGDDPRLDGLEIGTRVRLRARRDAEHWFSPDAVTALATEYGQMLPLDVAVLVPVEDGHLPRRITLPDMPWQDVYASPAARAQALTRYCEQTFGFTPAGFIDLSVPLAGVSGVAFVLPSAISPGTGKHRVYVKQMLLGDRVDGLLPDWAFFVRAVVNADGLNPTASREQLHTDEVLLATQEALAQQLREWATATLTTPGPLARRIIETHHLALRALALTDASMLDLVARVLPFETTEGPKTLAEIRETGEVVYAATKEAYQRVATVARAQGLVVVNAGYVYDSDLLARLAARADWNVRELGSEDLVHVLAPVDPSRELEALGALTAAREALAGEDCEVLLRSFAPEQVPAVLLRDRDGEHQRDLARERAATGGPWGEVLESFVQPQASRRLVLNDSSPLVRRLLSAQDREIFASGLRALYLSAVMLAGDGLGGQQIEALNSALGVLLDAGLERRTP